MRHGLQWLFFKSGIGASCQLDSRAFIRSEPNVIHPDLEYIFCPGMINDHGLEDTKMHVFDVILLP